MSDSASLLAHKFLISSASAAVAESCRFQALGKFDFWLQAIVSTPEATSHRVVYEGTFPLDLAKTRMQTANMAVKMGSQVVV